MIICPNLSNPQVAKEFNEIKDAIEAVKPGQGLVAAHQIWSLNNGNSIDKAPNGAESVLFNSLLEYYNGDRNKAIVAKATAYSNGFLKKHGDWTNADEEPNITLITKEEVSPKSIEYNSIGGVELKQYAINDLLDSGLIQHMYGGKGYRLSKNKDINRVKEICDQYGIWFDTFTLDSGNIKIWFKSKEQSADNKYDRISKSKSRTSVFTENYSVEQLRKEDAVRNDLISFLQDKFPQLEVNFITSKDLDKPEFRDINLYTNSFIIGNQVYVIQDRANSEIAAEELLHPLVFTIAKQNYNLFDQLLSEAKQTFPKLAAEIESRYVDKLGFTEETRQFELVTQTLARYVNKKYRSGEIGAKLKDLIKQFFNKVYDSLLSFVNKFKGNDNDFVDIRSLTMSQLADIVLAEDSKFRVYTTEQIQHAISSRQQAAQDESQRLIVRMNVLYRQYEKMKDKTPSQQKIADRIFETLNKLKQHRDIAAVGIALEQAKLSLGQYDEATGGPATMQTANIYDFLYKASQNNFDGVTAKQLVDMYRNTIKFYSDLIEGIPSEQVIDLSEEDKNNIKDIKNLIEDHIMPLWINAIMKVGDDLVDAAIDDEVEASDIDKEDMKKVAKDWLHKNMMYGDVNAVASYIYNYSYSSDPIIKQAFHLIQHAEQQTLEEVHHIAPTIMKAYQKANSGSRSFTPGWQSMLMEFDDENKPTGNFIRDINYGLYQKDLKEFIERLNQDFLNRYGFTYVTDDTGAVVNSLTNEFAEDEEWGPNGEMPKYVEYQLMIEQFKSPASGPARVNRRFVGEYYKERLSRPYDGTIDPYSPEFKDTRFNHGLSPKTLTRYNYYQSNINYYLNKCQDPNNGLVYPEKLSKDDKLQLDRWTAKMDKFTSIFNDDGSYKSGEDLKMAFEVRAWRKWIGSHTDSRHLQAQFNTELNQAYQDSVQKGDPSIYYDFLRFNASVGINPDYIEQTVGDLKSTREDGDLSLRGKLMKASLQDMVKSQLQYTRNLKEKENDPLFWLRCKSADQAIQDGKEEGAGGWSKDKVEAFQDNFYDRDILYVDDNNFYIDENGNQINPNDPNAKVLEEAGKLLTFRQYLINKYTNEAMTNGHVAGLIDESTGALIDFTGMSQQDVRRAIVSLLSYKVIESYPDGSVVEKQYPLTIFQMTTPNKDTFFNKKTGKIENTITYVGERRFRDSVSTFTNPAFNPNEGIAEKPNTLYDGGRYDNSENFNKVTSDQSVHDLYDLLIKTMEEMQGIYSTNRKFNYKLPMINARTSALFSRVLKRGYSSKAIKAMWDSMTSIEENDEDMRTKQDYFIGVDGQVANDVPLKFIRNLKNMEDLSTDVVSSVILFADMALNYKNKFVIDSTLKLLRYNMDPDNREIYDNKLKPKSEPVSKSNKNSIKMYDSMMDTLMYGNKFGDKDSGGPGKVTVAVQKTADAFQSLESSAMLGLNMFSMAVGFADSITRIFSESVMGKYMTKDDCLWALGKCLWYTPRCIKNMFNPLANNKMTALMQMNGISKGTFGIYTKTDWGKGRKFISDMLMGGWSMLDWMANSLLMMTQYHNIRFYEGLQDENGNDIVEPGFYSKYDLQQAFMRAGRSKHEATSVYNNYSRMASTTIEPYMRKDGSTGARKVLGRITLWDAYEFAPYVDDGNGNIIKLHGQVRIKPDYEKYVTQKLKTRVATKTKKRGGLYNGMNPDNDIPRWKRDVIGRLAGALRGWIIQQLQHLISGGTDNIARDFYTELKYETTPTGTRAVPKYKKKKLTDEQKARRMAWDYETGTPQDQILVALYRSLKTMIKAANQAIMFKPKTAKLSEVEKYAWKDSLIFIAMLAMMMVGWVYIHDDARTVQPPKNRQEAGPASMFNPVDYYNYMRDVYIPNQYWKLGVDDIYFRTVEAKISNVNPQQVLDIVSALTALKSGLDDQLGIVGVATDLINGEDNSQVLKQGAYKFYTKGDRVLYRAVGPAKNLHTALTYYGATNNLRWYTNKFGTIYRAFGYDFKQKDKDAENRRKPQLSGGDFSGGDFSGGDFSGGDFSGGNFE